MPMAGHDHIQGSIDAPLALVEYGDFQCPYCGEAHAIVKAIQERLGDRLCFAFRHFPLPMHPYAEHAAEAAEAAGAQGRFWEMHDLLYANQRLLDPAHLVGFAEELNLDTVKFVRELRDHVHHEHVREDFTSGVRSGVNGTPAFFINGFRYDGSWQFGPLLKALEDASVDANAI